MAHNQLQQTQDTSVNLLQMWLVIWRGKVFIAAFSVLVCVLAVTYSLTLPNIYKSSTTLAPQDDSESSALASLGGQLGGLASFAGMNLTGGGGNTLLHIEMLKSKDFLFPFFEKYGVGKALFAVKEYDKNTKQVIYNDEVYDVQSGQWLTDPNTNESLKPTPYEVYERFVKLFNVKHDKVTNLVTIDIKSISPHQAKHWVEVMVAELNELIRTKELSEKSQSIAYIQQQLEKTDVAQMKSVFYTIIEEQTKQMLLAEVRKDFAFKTIESPIVAERKDSPSRAVICILGAIFGVFFSVGLVLIRHFLKELKYEKG